MWWDTIRFNIHRKGLLGNEFYFYLWGWIGRKYFYPLTNSFECYKDKFKVNETPVAKYISERVLTLPLYADLSLEEIDRICDIILI